MPRLACATVYTFDELDEQAKERAREWMRLHEANDFDPDCVLDDAAAICGILGIDLATRSVPLTGGGTRHEPRIHYTGFSSQGDGACFEGRYRYAAGASAAIRAYAPTDAELHRIADVLRATQRRHFYALTAHVTHRGRDYHEYSTAIDVSNERAHDEAASDVAAEAITEALRDVMRWIYRRLEQEYHYSLTDEQIDEAIRVNAYEFTEAGRRA